MVLFLILPITGCEPDSGNYPLEMVFQMIVPKLIPLHELMASKTLFADTLIPL